MKVQLVTHSIIPNLNSGLVPIDPVGLVILTNIFVLTVSSILLFHLLNQGQGVGLL